MPRNYFPVKSKKAIDSPIVSWSTLSMRETDPTIPLAKLIAECGSHGKAAKKLGISQPYLSDLMRGRRTWSKAMLAKLGLRRAVVKADSK